MKIRIDNSEFEFLPEDLRHFKIDSAKALAEFIRTLKKEKTLGFKSNKK